MLRRTASRSVATSWPATRALPPVGRASVQSMLMVVVLPAPLGPRKPKTSPAATSKLTPRTASRSPNALRSSRTSTAFIRSLYGERGVGGDGIALRVERRELGEGERGDPDAHDARDAAGDDGGAHARGGGDAARLHVAEPRPAGDDDREDGGHAAAHGV